MKYYLIILILFSNCIKGKGQLKMIPQNAPQYFITDAVYNQKEKIVAFSEYRMNRVVFVDAVSKLRIGELPTESPVITLVTDSAGQYIIAATDRGNIHFIDAKNLVIQKTINANDYFTNSSYAILKNYIPLYVTKEHLYFTGYVHRQNAIFKTNETASVRPDVKTKFIYQYNFKINELKNIGTYETGSAIAFCRQAKEKKLLLLTEKKRFTINEVESKILDSLDITNLNLNDFGGKTFVLDEVINNKIVLLNSNNNKCSIYDLQTMDELQYIENVYRVKVNGDNQLLYQGMDRYFYTYDIQKNIYIPFSKDSITYRPWCYKMWAVTADKTDFITVSGLGNLDAKEKITSYPEKSTYGSPWGLAATRPSFFVFANGKNIYEYDYVHMQVTRLIATTSANVIQTKYISAIEDKLIVETWEEDELEKKSMSYTTAIDYNSGQQLWKVKNGNKRLEDFRISNDQSKALVLTDYTTVEQIDIATGKKVMQIPMQQNIYGVDYIGDSDSLFLSLAKEDKGYSLLGFGKNLAPKALGSFESHYPYRVFEMDMFKNYAAIAYPEDSRFFVVSFLRSDSTKTIEHNARIITYSHNNQWLAAGSFMGGYIRVFSFPDMKEVIEVKCGVGKVFDIIFSKDDKLLFAVLEDGHISVINIEKKAHVADVLLNNTNYLVKDAEGYYTASKTIVDEIGLRAGNRCFPISNADIKYNQPQHIAKAMGLADSSMIAALTNAYQKRIAKLKTDPEKINDINSFPSASIINTVPTTTTATRQTIVVKFSSFPQNEITSYNLWVNGVPLYGKNGKTVTTKTEVVATINVMLNTGMNKIEVECTSLSGVRSLRDRVKVHCTTGSAGKIYFIGIGLDKFENERYNLSWSVKDIRDLAVTFSKRYRTKCVIDTLFNEKVNQFSIKKLKKKLLQTTVNDKVIISYSGHGVLNKEYDYFLSTYNISFEKPQQNGLPYEELENLLDSIPARKKLLLIDACHSGEVDKEDIQLIENTAQIYGIKKGFEPDEEKSNKVLGLQNSFELMQNLFINVGMGTGATIISAAAGTQFALERNDLKNGVFTYSILETINKFSTIKISELKKIVSERVRQLTNGLQKPTSRSEIIASDWDL